MPTRRGIFIFLFTLIILITAWLSGLVLVYLIFAVSLGLILLSYALSHLLVFNLEIQRQVSSPSYEDDIATVCIKLRNRLTILDQTLEIEDDFTAAESYKRKKTILFNGLSKGSLDYSYQEVCYKRGLYRIGPFRVKIFEPLGLFYVQKILPVYTELVVYPRVFHVQQLPFILGHLAPRFGEQTTRLSGDYEEFYGIREYHQEDGWRRIHWPSTARLSELMVKHFELSSQWKATLILDAHKSNNTGFGKNTVFEYEVKIAASLAKYLLFRNASFGLIASNKNQLYMRMSKGKDHFFKMLHRLAVIDADGDVLLRQVIAQNQVKIPSNSSLILITDQCSKRLVDFLWHLKLKKNIGVIPIILNKGSFMPLKQQKTAQKKLNYIKNVFDKISPRVYFINCQDDLKIHFAR